jgi:hypothetical protein
LREVAEIIDVWRAAEHRRRRQRRLRSSLRLSLAAAAEA